MRSDLLSLHPLHITDPLIPIKRKNEHNKTKRAHLKSLGQRGRLPTVDKRVCKGNELSLLIVCDHNIILSHFKIINDEEIKLF